MPIIYNNKNLRQTIYGRPAGESIEAGIAEGTPDKGIFWLGVNGCDTILLNVCYCLR